MVTLAYVILALREASQPDENPTLSARLFLLMSVGWRGPLFRVPLVSPSFLVDRSTSDSGFDSDFSLGSIISAVMS